MATADNPQVVGGVLPNLGIAVPDLPVALGPHVTPSLEAADQVMSGAPVRSTGQCERQICSVKLINRIGYGLAEPDLLRQWVLHQCAA